MLNLPEVILPKKRHFGLSIGRTSLRALEVDRKQQVTHASEVILPDGVFSNGILIKEDILITAIKKLLEVGKFSTPYAAVCFSEVYAYSREYTLPKIEHEEISEAVSWHLKELFPFPVEDISFDWKILGENEKTYDLQIVAVQKQLLDTLVRVLEKCGIKPLSFEPGASSILKLLKLDSNKNFLIVEINRRGAYVTLTRGERSMFTTVVNYTSEDTPEKYLKNIAQTIFEIDDYYKKKKLIGENMVQVMLTGELAIEVESVISKELLSLKYPIAVLKTRLANPAYNKAYAVAIGAVAAPRDPFSINLLPISLQEYYDSQRRQQYYRGLSQRLLLVCSLLCGLALTAFVSITLKRQSLDTRVNLLRSTAKAQTNETQKLLMLNAQAEDIVSLAPLRITPVTSIQTLLNLIPEDIKISQLDYDDSRMQFTLSGVAKNRDQLLLLKSKLEQTEEFTSVSLPLGALEVPENVKFSMSFIVKL